MHNSSNAMFFGSTLFLLIVFLVKIAIWTAIGFGIYYLFAADWSNGLRGVLETIWCGEVNCFK